jgi:hypothetical protein
VVNDALVADEAAVADGAVVADAVVAVWWAGRAGKSLGVV